MRLSLPLRARAAEGCARGNSLITMCPCVPQGRGGSGPRFQPEEEEGALSWPPPHTPPCNTDSTPSLSKRSVLAPAEEEAWSDQSLLIFKHNWIGVLSQFKPFAPMVARTNQSAVDQVIAAHQAAQDTLKPYFREGVVAATPYTSVSMSERRKMADASNRFRDSLSSAGVAIGLDVEIQ